MSSGGDGTKPPLRQAHQPGVHEQRVGALEPGPAAIDHDPLHRRQHGPLAVVEPGDVDAERAVVVEAGAERVLHLLDLCRRGEPVADRRRDHVPR